MELPEGREPERGVNYASAGLVFGLTILVFVGIGWWLDAKLGSSPWLLILLTFVGFGGALYSLVRRVSPPGDTRPKRGDPPKRS